MIDYKNHKTEIISMVVSLISLGVSSAVIIVSVN